ncbi:MAG: DUF3883 domain-containing protein [Planctomycetaceae bacterium]|nr:DUF3883 domain-containing protein [Planctomycetaceae bacterium]
MQLSQLKNDVIVRGNLFPEPVRITRIELLGESHKVFGSGCSTGKAYKVILNKSQIDQLECSDVDRLYEGDARLFRLGIESRRLALAYEYDPYFALSIARVDPLPHQLEAVYDYFLRSPRIRFLLADDPGAGKTIMAGLLLKELKIRGLVKRTLIITPANLSFQWQRELKEKFREQFELMRGDVLRANYGTNPWQEKNQVITSISWVSRIEDANASLLRSHWDLIIVDEAHKMSAVSRDKKTLAYELGEKLSKLTDHYLLMTATPHRGDPDGFCLFLELLDRDVYGNVTSLKEAMKKQSAPFYLRRTKEALVTFPDPQTGKSKRLFTRREVKTVEFQISDAEMDLYDKLTDFVEEQSVKASENNTAANRALGFTMAMLQRRFASSIYAVRCTLERMRDRRKKILDNPEKFRQDQIDSKLPDDYDDLTDEEQAEVMEHLEGHVLSIDPVTLKEEMLSLDKLVQKARIAEQQEIETKLAKLKDILTDKGLFSDPKMKMLIFTEHKDTLDYLVGKLRSWGLLVTQIHGGMKVGDRDTKGTRIYAEREFREEAQVLVATEAAGEGINLQFCWLMINYDIPWNPVRLEQRMGRIHRYGQEKECLIQNFVSTNTREGRVLQKLFDRLHNIEKDIDPDQTGKVFNVLGDVFPSNQLEKMVREMYAKNQTENGLKDRIVQEINIEHFRKITHSTLEGLAKRELNLSVIVGKYAEAKERRLVPEVIELFFNDVAAETKISLKEIKPNTFRVGKLPQAIQRIGEQLESRYGKLGTDYKQIVFDRKLLEDDARSDWVTPGHPLFEALRQCVETKSAEPMEQGAVFFDLHTKAPYHLDIYVAQIQDGIGNILNKRILLVRTDADGILSIKEPTLLLDLTPKTQNDSSTIPPAELIPEKSRTEQFVIEHLLQTTLVEVTKERERQVEIIRKHLDMSLNELIHREQLKMAKLYENEKQYGNENSPLFEANKKGIEDRIDELNRRLKTRGQELEQERQCMLGDVELIACAWVLPSPQRNSPDIATLVRDDDVERIAVNAVIAFEEGRGWTVESVEDQNRGFDLISRNPQSDEFRYIEVKGRAGVGDVLVSKNEYNTLIRLHDDYWLYVVYHCETKPEVHPIDNPAKLDWQPIIKVEHYHIEAKVILNLT